MDYATEESLIDLFFLEILGITRRSKHVLQHFLSDLKCLQIYALGSLIYLFVFPFQLVYIKLERVVCHQVISKA